MVNKFHQPAKGVDPKEIVSRWNVGPHPGPMMSRQEAEERGILKPKKKKK